MLGWFSGASYMKTTLDEWTRYNVSVIIICTMFFNFMRVIIVDNHIYPEYYERNVLCTWLSTLPSGHDAHNVISKNNTKHWPNDCIDVGAISVDYVLILLKFVIWKWIKGQTLYYLLLRVWNSQIERARGCEIFANDDDVTQQRL